MLIEIKPMPSYARDWTVTTKNVPDHLYLAVEYISKKAIAFKINMHNQDIFLNIECVSSRYMKYLNKTHAKKNKVTNVLSFPSDLMPPNMKCPRVLGDIYLCIDFIKEEAEELGITFESHFVHMAAHGTLHLIGYDHEDENDALIMKDVEKKLLNNFGIQNPYSRSKHQLTSL